MYTRVRLRAMILLVAALLLPLTAAVGSDGDKARPVPATLEKFALVIGNAAYEVAPLRNPTNDAADVAAALKGLGFDVTLITDADQKTMLRRIDEFGQRIRGAAIALFYYSGHGVQVGKENYLIPVRASIETANDVEYEGVQLGRVLGKMEDSRSMANIVILDACRDNPFPGASKSGTKGLAVVEDKPRESMIVYATGAGQTAADGDGRNSPFSEALLKHIARTEDFYSVLLDVKRDVRTSTNNRQIPDNWDNLSGRIYLAGGSDNPPAPPPKEPPTPPPAPQPPPKPAGKTAEIVVTADRAGAEIFVDGIRLGEAPNLFNGIPAEREILIEARQGSFVARESLTLKTGELRELNFRLEREKGRLYIKLANAASYTLILDGEKQGKLSESGLVGEIGAGEREMELVGYGLYWKGKVTVKAGSETTIVTPTPWVDEVKAPRDYVFVQGGTFSMGSDTGESDEKPVHQVTVSSFMMGKCEITVGEFRRFVESTGYRTDAEKGDGAYIWNGSSWTKRKDANWDNPGFSQSDKHPVSCVSWNDAVTFCNWLSEREGLQKVYTISGTEVRVDFSRNGYRLPTEAEWEYAARGGSLSRGYSYAGSNSQDQVAWYSSNSGNTTHQVGIKAPNELGLYDMSGNVWEWCWDWYKNSYDSWAQTDPVGASSGGGRVNRGGCWYFTASYLRSANRGDNSPGYSSSDLGFRVLRRP